MPKSEKPPVIEHLYNSLIDPTSGLLIRDVVTNEDILKSILWCNENLGSKLSLKNPANFMKDIIRGKGATGMWPDLLKELKITARQITGDGNVFQFVPYAEEQTEPFPDRFGFHEAVLRHRIQSVSMPLASKELGRDDETYLIQVAVKLAVVETHFALTSPLNIIELTHLQIGIKLRLCELDSMFAAYFIDADGKTHRVIITAEAKNKKQRILEDQILRQVTAAFSETKVDFVVPIVMTSAAGGIYIAEFKAVHRDDLESYKKLELASEALYELVPRVNGI
jgi:hypothetical protein